MELTEEDVLCNTVCSSEFKCDWSKWNNPLDQEFPDGTLQSCVGAQVRCGCTTTMSLISYVTYEHPAVVIVVFFVLVTLTLVMLVKCIVIENDCYCDLNCCFPHELFNKSREGDWSSPRSSEPCHGRFDAVPARNTQSEQNSIQIYYVDTEKPPSYAYAMMQEILPPSYLECVKDQDQKKHLKNANGI